MSNYPTVRPSLTLDFQKSKQLDPRISFSRSSSATYVEGGVIKYADEHQARFEKEGLLIEESRTNLFDQSEDLTSWTSGLYTKTNNQAISPDGTLNAASLVPNVGTTSQASGRSVTQSAGNHVCSVFAKPNGLTILKIRFSGSSYQTILDLTGDGSIDQEVNGTASIYKYPNGWYRCVFAINDSVGETAEWQIGQNDTSNVDGINGFYIWGMQVEEGEFPSSYIPTAGSTVTRSADIAQINGDNFSSWYNQSEGTVFADFISSYAAGTNTAVASINNGGTSQRISLRPRNTIYGGTAAAGLTVNETPPNVSDKIAWSFDTSGLSLISGSASDLYNSALASQTLTQLDIGMYENSNANFRISGTISRLTFYPRRLTDSELETLTL